MDNFKIDKTIFKAQTFEEADRTNVFDKTVAVADRLRMAFHLTCTIYGIKEGDSLKLDRTIFSARKFNNA
jgi:hypothetical protein